MCAHVHILNWSGVNENLGQTEAQIQLDSCLLLLNVTTKVKNKKIKKAVLEYQTRADVSGRPLSMSSEKVFQCNSLAQAISGPVNVP